MTHYLYGEPRGKVVRLDDYRQAVEPDTFKSIGEVATKLVERLIRESEARRGEN